MSDGSECCSRVGVLCGILCIECTHTCDNLKAPREDMKLKNSSPCRLDIELGVEGRSKVVGEDTDVEKEGEVSDIHPEGCLGRFPVDMFAVREEIERCRRIRRHFCLLFVKSAEG